MIYSVVPAPPSSTIRLLSLTEKDSELQGEGRYKGVVSLLQSEGVFKTNVCAFE